MSCSSAGNSNLITLNYNDATEFPSTSVLDIKIDGIRNPRTTKPTDSIVITTYDGQGMSAFLINQGTGFAT